MRICFLEEAKTYSIYEMMTIVMVLMIFTPPITRMTTARWQTMESSTNYNFSSQMVSPIFKFPSLNLFSTFLLWPENPIETNTKIWLWVCVKGIQNWAKPSNPWLPFVKCPTTNSWWATFLSDIYIVSVYNARPIATAFSSRVHLSKESKGDYRRDPAGKQVLVSTALR